MDSNPLLRVCKILLLKPFPRPLGQPTKHKLRLETPLHVDLPVFFRFDVDDRVVVLQVGAAAFGLESGPQHVLVHGRGVFGPLGEVLCVFCEFGREFFQGGWVFEEEDLKTEEMGVSFKRSNTAEWVGGW